MSSLEETTAKASLRALSLVLSQRIIYLSRRLIFGRSMSFLERDAVSLKSTDFEELPRCEGNHSFTYVLVSLYRFKQHIPVLVESIESNACRKIKFLLLVVDPVGDEESALLQSLGEGANCKKLTFHSRISIYRAWNEGISSIRNLESALVTNLNADDLRRPSSICAQARHLESTPASVAFGDVALVDRDIPPNWGALPRDARRTQLAEFQSGDLLLRSENLPHSAPMWKGELHGKVGLFSPDFVSSGDADFWLRCQIAGLKFEKLNLVTSAYYANPAGLSTKLSSRGFLEWNQSLYQVCRLRPGRVLELAREDRRRESENS